MISLLYASTCFEHYYAEMHGQQNFKITLEVCSSIYVHPEMKWRTIEPVSKLLCVELKILQSSTED